METQTAVRTSYAVLVLLLALAIWLHLGTLLLTMLFAYLALQCFCFRGKKALSVALYCVVVIAILFTLLSFSTVAYHALPKIADSSIPAMVDFAESHGFDLPFADYESFKETALEQARAGAAIIGQYARVASFQFVLLAFGLVAAVSLFLSPFEAAKEQAPRESNPYNAITQQLAVRFQLLYESFSRVMGAQLVIASINTALTAIFLLANGFPYVALLLIFVFLCGLLPVIGNLISNTLIICVGFSHSPRSGLYALIFLIVIHKLEYFLNSKIIGKRIGNPMWLTLIALVIGERLLGVAGMVLAPVFLYYLKIECTPHQAEAEQKSAEA